jgi:Tol biopolymer transport system component
LKARPHGGRARRGFVLAALAAAGCVGEEPTLPTAPLCSEPLVLCGESCVDTETDPLNCGACGMSCDVAHGVACQDGSCGFTAVSPCSGELVPCGLLCVDTSTSAAHCGDCDTACDTAGGEVCSNGSCALSCAGGSTECHGDCVDTDDDPAHCGSCDNACSDGEVCSEGRCALACTGGTSLCGKSCVDFTSDARHCGGCDRACDTNAGERCAHGECAFSCTGGATRCGDACVDTSIDPRHCGDCDVSCGDGATCSGGACRCADGYEGDGQTCSDVDECATGNDCSPSGECLNTPGGYVCTCRDGQSGDGETCTGLELVTLGFTGTASSGVASSVALSDDGRYVAFTTTGRDFLDASLAPPEVAEQAYERDVRAKTTALVSSAAGGAYADMGLSQQIALAGDGGSVAFTTAARNLGLDEGGEISNVFVHDDASDMTVPRSITAEETAPAPSTWARLSADGSALVFSSTRKLTGTETDGHSVIYLSTGAGDTVELVSVTTTGELADEAPGCEYPSPINAFEPSISGDGQRIAFQSSGVHFTDASDTNCAPDVFVRDLREPKKPVTLLASAAPSGNACADPTLLGSGDAAVSADGRFVAFASNCTNLLAAPDELGHRDVFVRDLETGGVTRVSVTAGGAEADGDSGAPQISGDGRYVAFTSVATDLVPRDLNAVADVFVRDLVTQKTVRVDLDAAGAELGSGASTFALSANGAVLAFIAHEPLLPEDRSDGGQIYLRYLR